MWFNRQGAGQRIRHLEACRQMRVHLTWLSLGSSLVKPPCTAYMMGMLIRQSHSGTNRTFASPRSSLPDYTQREGNPEPSCGPKDTTAHLESGVQPSRRATASTNNPAPKDREPELQEARPGCLPFPAMPRQHEKLAGAHRGGNGASSDCEQIWARITLMTLLLPFRTN